MKKQTFCFLFLAILISGCEFSTQSTTTTDEELAQEAFALSSVFMRFYSMPDSPDLQNKYHPDFQSPEVARKNRKALMRAHLKALAEVGDLIEPKRALNTQEIETLKRFLDKYQDEEYHFLLEQSIAFYLSEPILLTSDNNGQTILIKASDKSFADNELESLSLATRLLIKNNNPNADLISTSLQALSGYWSEEEIENSARRSRAAANAWLDVVNKSPSKGAMNSYEARYQTIRDATRTLESMSS